MKHLGELSGAGRIEVKGMPVGSVEYSIDVWLDEQARRKSADGSAQGDMGAIAKAFNAGTAQLFLEGGGSVHIIITKIGVHGAELQISGPVPGF